MNRKRVALVVYVDLDPIPGDMHTLESAHNAVRNILHQRMPHYNPLVSVAPASMQPGNTEPRSLKDLTRELGKPDEIVQTVGVYAESDVAFCNAVIAHPDLMDNPPIRAKVVLDESGQPLTVDDWLRKHGRTILDRDPNATPFDITPNNEGNTQE